MVSRRLDKLSAGLALNNKFLPVHCVVARDEYPQRVLQDGFVIVPAHTKFHEIVSVVLRTMEADVGKIEHDERADGQILIKNWNPLPIPVVTENRTVTVQDILGDLMNVAVLKIRISKYTNSLEDKRAASLLKRLMPLVTDDREKHELVSKLCQVIGEDEDEDDDDEQQQQQISLPLPSSTTRNTTSPNGYSSNSSTSNTTDGDLINSDNIPLNLSTKQYSYQPIMASTTVNTKPIHRFPLSSRSSAFASLLSLTQQQQQQLGAAAAAVALVNSHNHIPHQFSSSTVKDYAYNRRQRERTTFDPHEETPRLLQIFTDTKHPTRYQIASICESLNALPCRKGKKPLEPYNIQYWFKNARAALKRKKRRFGNGIEAPQQPQLQQQQPFVSSSPKLLTNGGGHFLTSDEQSPAPIKFELDSSDEIDDEPIMPDDDDDDDDDEDEDTSKFIIDEKQQQSTTSSSSIHKAFNTTTTTTSSSIGKSKDESSSTAGNNYYFHYLQAFDISLTDQQQQQQQKQNKRSKLNTSEDSADDDDEEENVSLTSEGSPTQVALPLPLPSPSLFNNNNTTNFHHLLSSSSSSTTSKNSKLSNLNKQHSESIVSSYEYNRSRRNRIFIDPASEVPKLEQWFAIETHPDHILIERICTELNEGEYRTKFPKLESKHIRLWFKNHRAKVKRICRIQTPTTINETPPPPPAPPSSGQQQS